MKESHSLTQLLQFANLTPFKPLSIKLRRRRSKFVVVTDDDRVSFDHSTKAHSSSTCLLLFYYIYLCCGNQCIIIIIIIFRLISAVPSTNPMLVFGRAALLGLSGGENHCDSSYPRCPRNEVIAFLFFPSLSFILPLTHLLSVSLTFAFVCYSVVNLFTCGFPQPHLNPQ